MRSNLRLPCLALLTMLAMCLPAASALGQEMKLVGTWVVESAQRGGENFEQPVGDQVTFTESSMQVKPKDAPKPVVTLDIKVDASKSPGEIDLTMEGESKTAKCIYSIDGETLRLCIGEPSRARPSSFETKQGDMSVSLVFKRVKKE